MLRFSALALAVIAGSFVSSRAARAQTVLTSDDQRFDFADDGSMYDGTSDSYDGCYGLTVNGTRYAGGTPTSRVANTLVFPIETIGTLAVRRVAYVPTTGGWGRYLELIANPTMTTVHADVDYDCNLGSDADTVVTSTSRGDAVVDVRDDWIATDDAPDVGDPALAHVFQGPGARTPVRALSLAGDELTWSFSGDVPPGGVMVLMTFAVQADHRADSRAVAVSLDALSPEAMAGLDLYAAEISNFVVPCSGAGCRSSDGGIAGDGGPIFSRYGCCSVPGTGARGRAPVGGAVLAVLVAGAWRRRRAKEIASRVDRRRRRSEPR